MTTQEQIDHLKKEVETLQELIKLKDELNGTKSLYYCPYACACPYQPTLIDEEKENYELARLKTTGKRTL